MMVPVLLDKRGVRYSDMQIFQAHGPLVRCSVCETCGLNISDFRYDYKKICAYAEYQIMCVLRPPTN
jgi:hypothetical protein